MPGLLEGQVAIVTGAARGQGRSECVRLAEEGADIIAMDICRQLDTVRYPMATPEDLAETVELVQALDRRVIATETDVRDGGAVRAAVDAGVAELGRLDIVVAVIPDGSSVFCARGLLASDFVLRFDRSVSWPLTRRSQLEHVNATSEELVRTAIDAMRDEGFEDAAVTVTRSGDFRFPGQMFELAMPVPETITDDDIDRLTAQFHVLYEQTYGRGTAWVETPPVMTTYTVEVKGRRAGRLQLHEHDASPVPHERLAKGSRPVFLPVEREHAEVPIYDDARFTCGSSVTGPAIIDAKDTTILVPGGVTATRDEFLNYRLRRREA